MAEGQVSAARKTYTLPAPFFVLATQNPLEMEGTYPLPEAQLDRFAFKILLASPELKDLQAILSSTTGATTAAVQPVLTGEAIESMKQLVRRVPAASNVVEYAGRLVLATHPTTPFAPATVGKHVRCGASPRGAQAILLGAKATALADGRLAVDFADVKAQVLPALRHRIIMGFQARADGVGADDVLADVVKTVPEA
jgi:MoxR-like ATPase